MATRLKGVAKLLDRIFTVANKEFEPVSAVQTEGAVGVRIDGEWQIDVMAHPCGCIILSSLNVFVPQWRTTAALEMINRINVERVTGTLELDPSDRQMRLRHDIDAPPASINRGLLRSILLVNFYRAQNLIPILREFVNDPQMQPDAATSWAADAAASGSKPDESRIKQLSVPTWPRRINLN